jgi:poly [ADP-ribose] polymerase
MKGMSAEDFVDEHLEDRSTDLILSDPVKRQEIIDDIAYKPPKATKKKKGEEGDDDNSGESSAIAKKLKEIKSVMETLEEEEDDDTKRPAKKSKITTGDDSIESYAKAMKTYSKLKNDDLKCILRWNLGYGMTGTKDILLLRCIDGHVHGRLGRCPTCFQGKLQLKDEDAGVTVNCLGYYDEDLARRIPCGYAVANSIAPRLQPWYRDEPTEEEMEAMKNVTEEHVAMANGKMSSMSASGTLVVPPDLLSCVQELDTNGRWDDADIKTKAQLLVDIGTTATSTKLDYPQDEKKAMMSVGKMILQNQDRSAVEMIKLLMLEFGIATVKEEAKARQKSAMANSCVVPDNAGIIQVFQELGDYYFKEGNTNAGLTYKKAITAISSLDYAITSENAKGLGKGKTKLAGIGKGTADKIYEYYATGTIEKLVEKRAIHS